MSYLGRNQGSNHSYLQDLKDMLIQFLLQPQLAFMC